MIIQKWWEPLDLSTERSRSNDKNWAFFNFFIMNCSGSMYQRKNINRVEIIHFLRMIIQKLWEPLDLSTERSRSTDKNWAFLNFFNLNISGSLYLRKNIFRVEIIHFLWMIIGKWWELLDLSTERSRSNDKNWAF